MKYERSHKMDKVELKIRKLKRKPLVIVAGVLLLCNILWAISWTVSNKSWKTGEEVASVNGKPIKRETWMAAMEEQIGRETLLNLVNDQVMEVAAKKYKIDVTDKEVEFELALMRTLDNRDYIGVDMDKEWQETRSTIILEKVLTKDVVISDKVIKSNYEENASTYNVLTAFRTGIIVLPSKDDADQTLREFSGGSSFDVLARERSIDKASANLGGDIGYINEETEGLDKVITKAALSMKKDTMSNVLSLDNGDYAIIHVSDVVKGRKFKLKEAKKYIKRTLALKQLPESVSTEAFWEEFDAKWFYGNE